MGERPRDTSGGHFHSGEGEHVLNKPAHRELVVVQIMRRLVPGARIGVLADQRQQSESVRCGRDKVLGLAVEGVKGLDGIVLEGAKHEYGIPNQSIAYLRENRGVGLAAWRGIGAGYNKFVIESFIDELAAAQNADPVQFRLDLLKDEPRAQAVVKAVADKSGWGKPVADGHALGFSYAKVVETYVAAVGEISVDPKTGIVRAHKFWLALDPGIVLNPDSVLAQTEGNVIFGLSQTLKEQVSIVDGQVQQNNFYDYPVLRMSEMPEIDIQLMPTDNPAKGIGEAALPLVAPCVGNALFKLTGKRLRALPLSPERVKAVTGV